MGGYYNEMYVPIPDDYMGEQARIDLQTGNVAEPIAENIEMEQTTSRETPRSGYDEDNYAFSDIDEESSSPTPSINRFPNVTTKKIMSKNKWLNWSIYGTIAFSIVILISLAGVVGYLYTNSTGTTQYLIMQPQYKII